MSIGDEIVARVDEGRLFLLEPSVPRLRVRRSLLLTETMQKAVIDGPWQDEEEGYRLSVVLRAELEHFIVANRIWATINGPGGPKLEILKRLKGVDEIWEFKGRNQPQIRVFGRFADKDEFVATHWRWRRDLPNDDLKKWNIEFRRCRTTWRNLFPSYPPHKGEMVDDYIGGAQDTRFAQR